MKKLFEILGQAPLLDKDVGIEIECEGENLNPIDNAFWKTVDDGSLRGDYPHGRAEWVMKKPVPIKNVNAALTQLIKHQKDAKMNFSFRTSVHVHVNVQELTENQLINMVYTYMLLEEAMMNYCGRDRKGNRFCLRLADAEGILDVINYLVMHGVDKFVYNYDEDNIRYSGLNLGSIRKYGSIEFRGMRGNLDLNVLNTWCNSLVNIREYAKSVEKPGDVYSDFIKESPVDFLNLVLGDVAPAFIFPKIEKELQRSFSLSIDIPHTFSVYHSNIKKQEEVPQPEKLIKKPAKPNARFLYVPVGGGQVYVNNPAGEVAMNINRQEPAHIYADQIAAVNKVREHLERKAMHANYDGVQVDNHFQP